PLLPSFPTRRSSDLMTIVFSFERYFVISRAAGKGNVDAFVTRIQGFLATGNIDSAVAECDKQQGSVANVIKAGLLKYKEASADRSEEHTSELQSRFE